MTAYLSLKINEKKMRPKKILPLALTFLLVAGCTDFVMICSLQPFFLEKNVILVPGVEGIWSSRAVFPVVTTGDNEKTDVWFRADTACNWEIERVIVRTTQKTAKGNDTTVVNPMNYYEVRLAGNTPDTSRYVFRMVLFSIRDNLYADFSPSGNPSFTESRLTKENYFPVHTLARVKVDGGSMNLSWLGADYMKEMIEDKRVRVNYKWIESSKRLLLTGTSEQLTAMIERYAGEKRFIDWEDQLAMLHLNRKNNLLP